MLYARLEPDRDIHLVVADGPGQPSMIVELPDATCPVAAQSAQAPAMAAARLVLLQAVPVTATGSPLAGRAELSGVGFFDEVHGQFGVAPNGFELHPVLSFRLESPPPRLRLLSWRIRRVGHYLAERASLELCTLRPGGYRLGLNVQAQGRLHRFSGRFHQPRNERCSRTDVSFRLPAAARRQQLQATVTISGGRRLTVAAGRRLAAG